jgi:hypothetical protein
MFALEMARVPDLAATDAQSATAAPLTATATPVGLLLGAALGGAAAMFGVVALWLKLRRSPSTTKRSPKRARGVGTRTAARVVRGPVVLIVKCQG